MNVKRVARSKLRAFLISGPQGSGKTTQAEILAKRLGFCLVKTGDLIREFARKKNKEAIAVRRQALGKGELISDETAGNLVKHALRSVVCHKGFVLDGYPRRFSQLQFFDPGFDQVFFLRVSDAEAKKRLIKRGRVDDTLGLIRKRLDIYHEETEPLFEYYKSQGLLTVIDGEGSIDEVADNVWKGIANG